MASKTLLIACLATNGLLLATCLLIHPRSNCDSSAAVESSKLQQLRAEMAKEKIDAYIIPNADEHDSEFTANRDKRRKFFTGFDGSKGTAIVLKDAAALHTDGRYYIQADDQLDCNWVILKKKQKIAEWLVSKLKKGTVVAVDSKLLNIKQWKAMKKDLEQNGTTLLDKQDNLVDRIWKNRPAVKNDKIYVHDLKYAGKSWEDKVKQIRDYLKENSTDAIVISEMEEVAWTFNLRGNDVDYNPLFKSYALITQSEISLYVDLTKVGDDVKIHLNSDDNENCVSILDYAEIWNDLKDSLDDVNRVMLSKRVSAALYNTVPVGKALVGSSPIIGMKQEKNPTEIEGMKNAHKREAAAIAEFISTLDAKVGIDDEDVDEIDAMKLMSNFRAQKANNRGDSFASVSAFEENGATIHYVASKKTAKQITENGMFLFDTGGQYLDGTTDISRTVHFGNPTDFQKEMYTRVLMGQIDGTMHSVTGGSDFFADYYDIEAVFRKHIKAVGFNFAHGSLHGIGVFGRVHDPINRFVERLCMSAEPGYYNKTEKFGIRLENIVIGKRVEAGKPNVTFETISFVPYERKLIKTDLLEKSHVDWLNAYNKKCKELLVPQLKGNARALAWVAKNTAPL